MQEQFDSIAVKLVQVSKVYEGQVRALDNVSLEVRHGEYLCLMGPSGSGKSTLLHLIGALDRPTTGDIFVNGKKVDEEADLDTLRSQHIGFVFQLHNLLPTLTAVENVEIPMYARNLSKKDRRARALELLQLMNLEHRSNFIVTKLSGGERQRVAIARALANKPSLILADEPTGDLDSKSGQEVMEALFRAKKEAQATLIIVTHNPEIALRSDRVLEMRDGAIQTSKKP